MAVLNDEQRERKRSLDRAYYTRNKERIKANVRRWVIENRDHVREWSREYMRSRLRFLREHSPEYREMKRLSDARYYLKTRGKRMAYIAQWQRDNRERHLANKVVTQQRRRSRQLSSVTHFTVAEWQEKKDLLGNVCFYCGEDKPLTVDHKVPLSRDGTNDITNILPACKSCNTRKGSKTACEYLTAKAA